MKATFRHEREWLTAIAAMVREGVTFDAFRDTSAKDYWVIEFTGGF